MGIKDLKKVLVDFAPQCLQNGTMEQYFGRRIAIDASMFLYSFLIAIRTDAVSNLVDATGEGTSHLSGMFHRTVRMMECGLQPVYVFDGKPPTLKSGELALRSGKKKKAAQDLKEAQETGDQEAVEKLAKRTVHVTAKHNEESKKLLRLMGVPVIEAPCEAEAQCAELCKKGKVWATATEDMDALTFGTPILLRNLTMSEAKKLPIIEITLAKALEQLNFTMPQFIDLCILLGSDYNERIPGVGPKKAYNLIKENLTLEKAIADLDAEKYEIPESIKNVDNIRPLFLNPEVIPGESINLEWKAPDTAALIQFMVGEKSFNPDRINSALARMEKGKAKCSQNRLTNFFQVLPSTSSPSSSQKRKAEEDKKKKAAKKPAKKK